MIAVKNCTCWPVSTWVSDAKSFLTCNLLGQEKLYNGILIALRKIYVAVTGENNRTTLNM